MINWPSCLCLICTLFFLQSATAQKFKIEKLGGNINTQKYDEISPVVSIDGKTMYFTRVGYPTYRKTLIEDGVDLSQTMESYKFSAYLRKIFSSIARSHVSDVDRSSFNQDIWIARKGKKHFDTVEHPEYPLNNALPNSVCSLTPAENEAIVLNQFEKEGGMKKGFSLVRRSESGEWSFPMPMVINNYHNSGPDVSMTMSHDGSTIILAMQREDSYGYTDLYISHNLGNDVWSQPKNMGPLVNSGYRESTPYLSPDNNTLFFSSNRHGTIGGNDIFIMKRLNESWDTWAAPQRFIAPINSRSDDSQPYFDMASGCLYFTSKRDGSSDIFKVKLGPPTPVGVTITGKIINSKTGEPMSAEILSGIYNTRFKNTYVSSDGTFKMTIPKGVDFRIVAKAPGYEGKEIKINYNKNHIFFKEYVHDLELTPIEAGNLVKIDPIYFQQSRAEVLKKSYPAMDKLAKYLKDNPSIYVEIGGHTDNQGDRDALLKLSQERADAIKDYLVYKKKIKPVRIETVGYGPDQPVSDNKTADTRSLNRRVEVKITFYGDQALGMDSK